MNNYCQIKRILFLCFTFLFFFLFDLNAQTKKVDPQKVYLKKSILKKSPGQSARDVDNNEIKINLYAGNKLIDSYDEYGSGDYDEKEMAFYLSSDISQKTYRISKLHNSQIKVSYLLFFEGEEKLTWEKTYLLNSKGVWIKSNCEGDCN